MPRHKPGVPDLSDRPSLKICEVTITCGMRCVFTETDIAHKIDVRNRSKSILYPARKEPRVGPAVDLACMLRRKYLPPVRFFLARIRKRTEIFSCRKI